MTWYIMPTSIPGIGSAKASANGIATEAPEAELVPAIHPVLVAILENPLVGRVVERRGLPTRPLHRCLLPGRKAPVSRLGIPELAQLVKLLMLLSQSVSLTPISLIATENSSQRSMSARGNSVSACSAEVVVTLWRTVKSVHRRLR
jgi:hypothetical protein